jgi:hypothetical protein
MKIINGRWVDDNEQPIDHFNMIHDTVPKWFEQFKKK